MVGDGWSPRCVTGIAQQTPGVRDFPHRSYPVFMEDPAFVWQAQDRPARPMPTSERVSPKPYAEPSGPIRWVTLHEAEEVSGVPASTIRNWARKDRIPTQFELSTEGQVRMVGLDEVVARARHLGRLRPKPATGPDPVPPPRPTASTGPAEQAPEGSVLVPVDAWNRMINQLGNLHEAGQQLAEARERAAKAETEATFLRERLAEMRKQAEERVVAAEPRTEPVVPVAEPVAVEPALAETQPIEDRDIEPAWLYLYRRWENRSRRRRR